MDRGSAKDLRYVRCVYLDVLLIIFQARMRNMWQSVRTLYNDLLSVVIFDNDVKGYCFGGPFALEIATTDNVVAGMSVKA